jgi:pyridoxine kinase
VKITNVASLVNAISTLHRDYRLPHVFVTSTHLEDAEEGTIALVGSTATSDMKARVFRIDVPYFPVYFTGTGDMFAALLVARLRDEATNANVVNTRGWRSDDDVEPTNLPLAKAAEKVVATMQAILKKTYDSYSKDKGIIEEEARKGEAEGEEDEEVARLKHLKSMRAVELKVVRNVSDLINPPDAQKIKARVIELE